MEVTDAKSEEIISPVTPETPEDGTKGRTISATKESLSVSKMIPSETKMTNGHNNRNTPTPRPNSSNQGDFVLNLDDEDLGSYIPVEAEAEDSPQLSSESFQSEKNEDTNPTNMTANNPSPTKHKKEKTPPQRNKTRITIEAVIESLTDPVLGLHQEGINAKQLYDHILATYPENYRPNRSKNHLQRFPDVYKDRVMTPRTASEVKLDPTITPPHSGPEEEWTLGEISDEKKEYKMLEFGLIPKSPVASEKKKEGSGGKGRPTRKRTKKNLGPEFVEYKAEKKAKSGNGVVAMCDKCLLGQVNALNKVEPFLTCKECSKKFHPSCMGYGEELAETCRRVPWQCIDCKLCRVCNTADNADSLLLCDECDNAFHMYCIDPPMEEKPDNNEKWFCAPCVKERETQASKPKKKSNLSHKKKGILKNGELRQIRAQDLLQSITPPVCECDANKVLPDLSKDATYRIAGVEAGEWDISNVRDFISGIGFDAEAKAFFEQEIDGQALLLLKRTDVLSRLSLKLGPALKLYRRIYALQSVYERNTTSAVFRDISQNGLP